VYNFKMQMMDLVSSCLGDCRDHVQVLSAFSFVADLQVMLAFASTVHDEYCVRVQSQKRAVLQRAAKVLAPTSRMSASEERTSLAELFEVLKLQGHELYRKGAAILYKTMAVDSPASFHNAMDYEFGSLFEQLLEALLGDVLMFELAADHVVCALRGTVEMAAETLRSYTYAAIVMPALRGGSTVEEFRCSMLASGKL
jgi:hypothetical protein